MADPSITDIDPTGDIILIVPADPESGANKRVKTGEDGHSSKPTSPKAQFRVSSKHLTLASAYFKGRLGSHWTEGKILSDRGAAELELAEADPKALSILLHIIHGRTRQVPRCVTPEEVFTLATLTDYLQCQEVIEPFGVSWIKAIESTYAETGLTPRLKQWIAAAVCFRHEIILKTATKIVYMHGTGRFNAGNLPIPRSVIAI
ncbi:hypothetical protein N7512_010283 [Penicillium capsulatum]|nr:hypothetical protein N7512_010283 [Penicillium capsulatum]